MCVKTPGFIWVWQVPPFLLSIHSNVTMCEVKLRSNLWSGINLHLLCFVRRWHSKHEASWTVNSIYLSWSDLSMGETNIFSLQSIKVLKDLHCCLCTTPVKCHLGLSAHKTCLWLKEGCLRCVRAALLFVCPHSSTRTQASRHKTTGVLFLFFKCYCRQSFSD